MKGKPEKKIEADVRVRDFGRHLYDTETDRQIEEAATRSAARIREASLEARRAELERLKMLDAQA